MTLQNDSNGIETYLMEMLGSYLGKDDFKSGQRTLLLTLLAELKINRTNDID